jgi:hypothetical protein
MMWQSTQGRATPNRSLLWIIPGSVAVPAGIADATATEPGQQTPLHRY